MQEICFYAETEKYAKAKKILVAVCALPGAFLVFTGLLKLMGENNGFVRMCVKWSLPLGVVFAAAIIGAIIVYFRNRVTVSAAPLPQGRMQIEIRKAGGDERSAAGRFTFHALYTKQYYKLGTYRKQIYLLLYCDDKLFCMLRHEIAPAFPPPRDFHEVSDEPVVTVPVYFSRSTLEIFAMARFQLSIPQHHIF